MDDAICASLPLMADPDQNVIDDPSYAEGVLVGRKQAVTDVMERLLAPDADVPESIIAALVNGALKAIRRSRTSCSWCCRP